MYCKHCGAQVESSSRFCPTCGTAIASAPPPIPPPGVYPQATKLTRPRENRMIAGVCAGFALHYGWDLNLVRIVTAVLVVLTGVGAIAYLAAWVIIPEAPYNLPIKST